MIGVQSFSAGVSGECGGVEVYSTYFQWPLCVMKVPTLIFLSFDPFRLTAGHKMLQVPSESHFLVTSDCNRKGECVRLGQTQLVWM
jgi:hypothetical protein